MRARVLSLLATVTLLPAAPAAAEAVDAGPLRAETSPAGSPWALRYVDRDGREVVSELAGSLRARIGGTWRTAGAARDLRRDGDGLAATLSTDDPGGATLSVRVTRQADGVLRVRADGPDGSQAMGLRIAGVRGERFLGFGERSDAVMRTGGEVENRVTEGPYQDVEEPFLRAFVPPPGYNDRRDATYFPVAWLLSTAGYGVLLEGDHTSRFALGTPWEATQDGATLAYRVYAGPRPADVLRRFTADTGRQPPAAAPWFFGPWWQPSRAGEKKDLQTLRAAGAAGSVAQTYLHYLPCGDQQGIEADQPARTKRFHDAGLAVTTYFNPMICTDYEPRWSQAVAAGVLTKDPSGEPYEYRYTGSSQFFVGQFDFTAPGAGRFFGDLLDEAVGHGYDGWMEDFGEYTPPDAVSHDGTPGPAMHNRYPTIYHAAAHEYATSRTKKPLARFNRSGWLGTARHSQIVWGGDPSTSWGFDGLASSIQNGLSMGLSGVSLWGSDIGGFFALSQRQTSPELLRRWIQAGFAQGVMRTQANGFDLGQAGRRAQITDPEVLPTWVRWSRLRTRLQPYLAAAQREYDRTGMPMMRHGALTHPDDPAAAREDQYLLGGDLLVAPVLQPGGTARTVHLPEGRWIDLWRSVELDPRTAQLTLRAPKALSGPGGATLPAPAEELPLLVRDGTLLALLPEDVETLTAYGKGATVRLADRPHRRTLLAWPDRGPSDVAHPADDATARHALRRDGSWVLRVRQDRRRRYDLQVVLPRRPRCLRVDGRHARFVWADGVLRASVKTARRSTVVASRRCGQASRSR